MRTSFLESDPSLPLPPSSEASEIPASKRPIHTQVLPGAAVILDAQVREGFLSEDLETICAAATVSGATILIATAGKALDDRVAAFQLWRKKRLEEIQSSCGELAEFLSKNTHPELCASYRDGTVESGGVGRRDS